MEIGPNGGLIPTKKTEASAFELFCRTYAEESAPYVAPECVAQVGQEMSADASYYVAVTCNNLLLSGRIKDLEKRDQKSAKQVLALYAQAHIDEESEQVRSFREGDEDTFNIVCAMAVKQAKESR